MTYRVYAEIAPSGSWYFLMNFNDFPAAMVALFHQMVINNWYSVVELIAKYTGRPALVRTFFVVFWVIAVLILVNIVVAVVIEIHESL
mmetsp:Transcript_28706/g.38275  ORF Transcript_28706/g.38275 Transcript_28706/m.38275 type:complete len:88 (+) Transcript_28706:99-362(+)